MYLKETNCRARLGKYLCAVFPIYFIYLYLTLLSVVQSCSAGWRCLVNHDLENLKEAVEAQFEVHTWNVHWQTEKNVENFYQNSQWPGQVLNPGPCENTEQLQPTLSGRSAV